MDIHQMLENAPTLAVQHEALTLARGQRYADGWLTDLTELAAAGIEPGVERRHLRNWDADATDAFRGKTKSDKPRGPKLAYNV